MIKHLKLFWEILSLWQKKIFITLVIFNIFISILEIVSLGVLFPIIYSLLSPDSINNIPIIKDFLDNYAPVRGRDFIILALAFTIIGFIIKNVLFGVFIWFRSYYMEKIIGDISQALYLKYMHSPYLYHIRRNTGEIIRNITSVVDGFRGLFLFTLLELITHLSIGISYMIFLTYIDPTLMTYFICIMIVIMAIINYKVRATTKKLAEENAELNIKKNHLILLGIQGFKEIKILLREKFFIKNFDTLIDIQKKVQSRSLFFSSLPKMLFETSVVFLALSAIIILFIQDQSPQLIIAKLGVFGFAALKILPIFSFFAVSMSNLSLGGINLEIIHQELSRDNSSDDSFLSKKIPSLPFKKSIELKNIHFHFGESAEKNRILNGIDLSIDKRNVIGLVGSSGSGKTTLVDVITGILSPQTGEILIDGKPLKRPGLWTNRIGYIPQQIYLFDATIKENIALGYPLSSIDDKRIWEVLEIAQLREVILSLPRGIDTEIGDSGVRLSGGQRQRVGIARALYHKPELLILDEATSALDNRTEMDFITQLKHLKIPTTQIIIAHRLSTVKHCDMIYVLHHGRIVEKGNYSQLEKKGTHFRRMLLKDTKGTKDVRDIKKPSTAPKKNSRKTV